MRRQSSLAKLNILNFVSFYLSELNYSFSEIVLSNNIPFSITSWTFIYF